jgi:hypothetical protein
LGGVVLVVKVEVWPAGRAEDARLVGVAGLANVSDLAERSDYVVVWRDDLQNRGEALLRDHRRGDGFWPLIGRTAELRNDLASHRDVARRLHAHLDFEELLPVRLG